MRNLAALLILFPASALADCARPLLDHSMRKLASEDSINLCEAFKDEVVLIVNTASKCGNTHQYAGLEAMHEKYREQGFAVVGFPSNDFLGQEPGTEAEIKDFCRLTYGVQFPMFEKSVVKGSKAIPLYRQLTEATGKAPRWNFQKYLVDRDGAIEVFTPRTLPEDPKLVAAIEAALADQ